MTHEPLEPAPAASRPARARFGARNVIGLALSGLLAVGLGATGAWLLTHPQRVADQITVWQFEPDATIVGYADRVTMTGEGRFLFYASRPEVLGAAAFDKHCSTQTEDVGILGCYLHNERRIYLFDVTDDRLDGLEEVVAAHEMLHAAWDRMSQDERDTLAPLLEAEVAKRSDDTDLAQTLSYYATAEPGERLNELHSIVGTEFSDLSPALEAHYAKYFTDRATLVGLHVKSQAVFDQQQAAIDALVGQIDALKASVDADYAAYNAGYDQLNSDITAFNERADAGTFTSQYAFTTERQALVDRQAALDASYASISDRVTQYDGLVAQLSTLNAQVADLNASINIVPRDGSDDSGPVTH